MLRRSTANAYPAAAALTSQRPCKYTIQRQVGLALLGHAAQQIEGSGAGEWGLTADDRLYSAAAAAAAAAGLAMADQRGASYAATSTGVAPGYTAFQQQHQHQPPQQQYSGGNGGGGRGRGGRVAPLGTGTAAMALVCQVGT